MFNQGKRAHSKIKYKQSSLKCFVFKKSKNQNHTSITSPEYKMADRIKTRQHSKKEQKGQNSGENSDVDSEPEVYHGVLPCPQQIQLEDFKAATQEEQMETIVKVLNNLCAKITEIDITLNHDTDGMNTRLQTVQTQADGYKSDTQGVKNTLKIVQEEGTKLKKEVVELQAETKIIRGVLQKHNSQLTVQNEKVAMLTAKSMEKNVTISGLLGDNKDEKCVDTVLAFFRAHLEIDVNEEEILVAHRIGKPYKDKQRTMIVRCSFQLKERIFNNVKNLKDKVNEKGDAFYINKQLPEVLSERNRKIREQIREQKEKDKDLPFKERAKIQVINKSVHIDGEQIVDYLQPVRINEMFPDKTEKEKQEKVKLATADVITEKGSTFMAYAAKTSHIQEVRRAYRKVKTLHPNADHVIGVYMVKANTGYQDDLEHGAGHRLLAAVKGHRDDLKTNFAVFVVRVYGGIHLGPARFHIINKIGQQALMRLKNT